MDGIEKTVQWLEQNSFEVCRSSDGEGAFDTDGSYVLLMIGNKELLVSETDRLLQLLLQRGIEVGSARTEDETKAICLQADYDPVDNICFISLLNITDKKLFSARN